MARVSNDTHISVQETSKRKKSLHYFLLLVSPLTWFRCFALIFCRTQARTRSIAFVQYTIFILAVLLMIASCYLFYAVTADSGQYNLYLSNVASKNISMIEGRQQFDDLIWRTVLKTFFLGLIFGLIQACNLYLAAQWRQRLCDRFEELLFRSPNGCVLYETAQADEDMSKIITNDVKQFTSNFATVLFGSMFFAGTISVFAVIIIACVFLVLAADGDASGILICFVAFIVCVLIILPTTQLYNRNLMQQSKLKGRLRGYMQRIQVNAECIVLYASQRVELKYIERFISNIRNSMLIGSIGYALVNFPIQLLTALNGMCTYVIPTVVFFFIRNIQSPDLAQKYLVAIPLYSFLITVLGQLLLILEPALVTVTMGNHLWTVLNRLESLTKQHQKRIAYERDNGIRQENANILALHHLNISIPNAVNIPLLQSDVNLEAARGQCVLISGPSGCGKTTLFRICAGLQPVDAKRLVLPERRHLIFIPQRPYLPLGSLRFQTLILLKDQDNIKDKDLYELFQTVNLQYLLERYTLDTIVDWPTVLSVGEQQRLAFIRLFAFFILTPNNNQLIQETLVLFDESTSAIDTTTEQAIYDHLIQLHIWFVTISHRPSLIHLHTKSLQLSSNKNRQQLIEQQIPAPSPFENNDENKLLKDETNKNEPTDTGNIRINGMTSNDNDVSDTKEKKTSKWRQILEILKFIHVPFQSDDRKLKFQTIIAWLLTLAVLGVSTWCTYRFTKETASLYSVLSDYSSSLISLADAKQSIKSNIVSYVILTIATPALFSLSVGGGQVLATLYTRRQMIYLTRLLLDGSTDEYENNLLYHSRHMTAIPNFVSHDITELNSQLFYLIIGHVYYTGIIGQIILAIVLSVLLGEQNGGPTGVLVVYLFVLGFFIFINLLSALFNKWNRTDEVKFAEFVTAHKRVDLQAEQIVFSGEDTCKVEENELHRKLDSSIHSQIRAGFFFSIIVGVVRLSIVNTYLVNYGIPAAIFFHAWYDLGVLDPTKASTFITLSVYMYKLFSSWNYINYFADPLTHIQSIGIRIIGYLERLHQIRERHRQLAINEREQGRRQYIKSKSNEPSIILEHVDIHIPQSSYVLVSNINLTLSPNDNLIITGPSGCGKSTLLRLLAGLIPNESDNNNSILRIFPRQNTIFLCQQLHLIEGTLREQLSYLREAHGLGPVIDDIRAQQLLNELGLGHLIDYYSMDGEQQNWSQLLSIGEQQRLMMVTAFLVGTDIVRLFILDETTSGCDKQTEEIIYEYLQRSHIQFLSVSHRKEINKYHSRKLTINGNRHLII